MCPVVGLMVGMVGMVGMWCLFAMRRGGTSVLCGGVGTFGLSGGGMGRGPISTGLGGRSWRSRCRPGLRRNLSMGVGWILLR